MRGTLLCVTHPHVPNRVVGRARWQYVVAVGVVFAAAVITADAAVIAVVGAVVITIGFFTRTQRYTGGATDAVASLCSAEQRARHQLARMPPDQRRRAEPAWRTIRHATRVAVRNNSAHIEVWAELAADIADELSCTDGLDPVGYALDDAERLAALIGR